MMHEPLCVCCCPLFLQASGEAVYTGDLPLQQGCLHAAYVTSTQVGQKYEEFHFSFHFTAAVGWGALQCLGLMHTHAPLQGPTHPCTPLTARTGGRCDSRR